MERERAAQHLINRSPRKQRKDWMLLKKEEGSEKPKQKA